MTEYNIKEIFLESSSPYLIAEEGMWIDGDRKEISYKDMDVEYKTNCLRLLVKEKDNIMDGSFLSGVKFDRGKYGQEILQTAIECYTRKIIELKAEIAKV